MNKYLLDFGGALKSKFVKRYCRSLIVFIWVAPAVHFVVNNLDVNIVLVYIN